MITEEQVAAHARVRLHNASSSHAVGYRLELSLIEESDYTEFAEITKRKRNRTGGRYRMFLTSHKPMPDGSLAMEFEVWFLGWTVSNTGGAKIRFDLAGDEDFAFFRSLPAGDEASVWDMVLVELSDDDEVVDQKARERIESLTGGPKSQKAGRMCADIQFQRFVAVRTGLAKGALASADACADYIRRRCHISSRAQLDHEPDAWERFKKFIDTPYSIFLSGDIA